MAQKRGGSRGRGRPDDGEQLAGDDVRTALISGNTFYARAVQYTVVDGLAIFEGDIILGTVEEVEETTQRLRAEQRQRSDMTGQVAESVVISGSQFRWSDCRVFFTIDPGLPNQQRVTDAIAHWESRTAFRFIARTTEDDFVTFQLGTGCSSSVGRRGGQQFINLAAGCDAGRTIHEIGHAIGFWHEQSREDRDAFVTIHWDKIQAGKEHNFNQHITDGDDVGAYDYGSIMHYERDAFSIDGSDTITPTDPTAVIGQRIALSAGDIASAGLMCPITLKEGPHDTFKELIKDVRLDTKKEFIKEAIFDTFKEQVRDTLKEGAFDPPTTWVERIDPFGGITGRVVQPGFGRFGPMGRGGGLPFAMATPHQAPGAPDAPGGAGAAAGMGAAIMELDARLAALADQISQLDNAGQQLHAQYEQLAMALAQAVDAFDRMSRG